MKILLCLYQFQADDFRPTIGYHIPICLPIHLSLKQTNFFRQQVMTWQRSKKFKKRRQC